MEAFSLCSVRGFAFVIVRKDRGVCGVREWNTARVARFKQNETWPKINKT